MISAVGQDLINAYQRAPLELAHAIAGLSDSDLDQARADGKWTIREIVHHLIDCDMNYFQINRYALADTGATYLFNDFNGDVWSAKMSYRNRSIDMEMKLFAMMRDYISYLCSTLPDSLDRVLVHEHGKATVSDALKHDIRHASHHIGQIYETRRIHNL
ncbi:DinB family protein [Paenibacillus lignilyticus]|uniref:DinB family protein n=1 Tax=Paenibacillus lignilyticus TaxID=1172615 RepID=A0ABS5CAA2_9BACL|nr:DinB family protein [Paenibacillus lignilyticus]MBP3962932.1 DinB family protein [Paenibacillus lignilyticus]